MCFNRMHLSKPDTCCERSISSDATHWTNRSKITSSGARVSSASIISSKISRSTLHKSPDVMLAKFKQHILNAFARNRVRLCISACMSQSQQFAIVISQLSTSSHLSCSNLISYLRAIWEYSQTLERFTSKLPVYRKPTKSASILPSMASNVISVVALLIFWPKIVAK